MSNKLIRIDFSISYSVVGENIGGSTNLDDLAKEILRINRQDILNEAFDNATDATVKITGSEINSKEDLSKGYTLRTLPWGNAASGEVGDKTIGQLMGLSKNEFVW
jgi:outer membrane receptor protein involved in Fe transport